MDGVFRKEIFTSVSFTANPKPFYDYKPIVLNSGWGCDRKMWYVSDLYG